MSYDWIKRKQKGEVRAYALQDMKRKKQALWLPGDECADVRLALEEKVITYNSCNVFVERNANCMYAIEEWEKLQPWKHKQHLHFGELHDLTLPWKLDFAFLDFLGAFENNVALWMGTELSDNLLPGADMCVTHSYGWRNNAAMYTAQQQFEKGKFSGLYRKFMDDLKMNTPNVVIPMAMMKSIFNKWNFEIRWPCYYKDSVRSMMFYRLENFQPQKKPTWPNIKELLEVTIKRTKKGSRKPSEPSEPSKPKPRTQAQKRSDAAHKAWETRRKRGK